MVGQQQYQGNGRRGGRPLHGRGRGRGKFHSRRLETQHATSKSPHPEPSAAKNAESTEVAESSANASEKASQSAPAPGDVPPNRRVPKIQWCELCRVDCTSLEILEQHKNGKRHKKNLLRIEELKKVVKPGVDIQNLHEPTNDSKPEVSQQPEMPTNAQEVEEQKPTENLCSEAVTNEHGLETSLPNNTHEKPEVPMEESSDMQGRKARVGGFDNRKRGMKRKMKGGRGGKRVKSFETPRQPVEPPNPKVVIPIICDLCNVKCDTQEVFNRHLSGKKHIAKLKRFEGHQAIYGPVGLQALYPPNPIAHTRFISQGNQPFYDSQGSSQPFDGSFPSHPVPAAAGLDHQFIHSALPQQSEATFEYGAKDAAMVTTGDRQQVANV